MYFLINIYSDNYQFAIKYLKDTKVNLNNILIIMGDFNIRDNNWNPFYIIYDHALLLVHIIIEEEFIQEKKLAIVKNKNL